MSETEPKTQVALVTGAGRGIGRGIAERLAADGFHVVCASRNPDSCGSAAQAILSSGASAEALPVDVGDAAAVEKACASLLEKHGTVDVLVNNAGITRDGLIVRMSESDWEDVLRTNLSSAYYFCRHLARPMTRQRWGRIVNISSVIGIVGNAGQVNYSATKAGLFGLTKSLAKELASRSITVNAVAPGFIETDMTQALDERQREGALGMIPLKRFGQPADIAEMVAFLVSKKASYITGQTFSVDGGMTM